MHLPQRASDTAPNSYQLHGAAGDVWLYGRLRAEGESLLGACQDEAGVVLDLGINVLVPRCGT
eukprot:6539866-Pyramimonas_sp.AAC.1